MLARWVFFVVVVVAYLLTRHKLYALVKKEAQFGKIPPSDCL